jgi:hypothetical protein
MTRRRPAHGEFYFGRLWGLPGELLEMGRERPLIGGVVSFLLIGGGSVGAFILGPWNDTWYPGLFAAMFVVIAAGVAGLRGLALALSMPSREERLPSFLDSVLLATPPFVVCLECPTLFREPVSSCPDCSDGGELYEVRTAVDRRLVFTHFGRTMPAEASLHA